MLSVQNVVRGKPNEIDYDKLIAEKYGSQLEQTNNTDYATVLDIIINEWCNKYNLSIDWFQRCDLRQNIYKIIKI